MKYSSEKLDQIINLLTDLEPSELNSFSDLDLELFEMVLRSRTLAVEHEIFMRSMNRN